MTGICAVCLPTTSCNGNGVCDTNGNCQCNVGFIGEECDMCDDDYYDYPTCRCK